MGIYILLADDDHKGFESNADWEPRLYEYQQKGANVLFFTFIHPQTMDIPPGYNKNGIQGRDSPFYIYRVCQVFILTKRDDYFWVDFDHFWRAPFLEAAGAVAKIGLSLKPNHHVQF